MERAGIANIEFLQADVTDDLGHGVYDAVAAIECLVEIPDDERALETMALALRSGGLFVVQAPEQGWQPVLRGSEPTWRDEVRHGYSARHLSDMLAAAGLRVTQSEGPAEVSSGWPRSYAIGPRPRHVRAGR